MNLRKLSLLLAVMMIVSSFTVISFAAEDAVIDAWSYTFSNYIKKDADGNITQNSNITPKNIIDETLKATVKQFTTDAYYSAHTGGSEPRQYLVGGSATAYTELGGIDSWKDYGYLRISTNIYIGDTDDGLAFRMRRRNTSDDTELAQDIYIGIGGSDFVASVITNGYRYVNKSLEANKWHNVVIELGSNKTDVNFYIDNKFSLETEMEKITNKTAADDVVTGMPEGTYGFGGTANRCVLIPKSASSNSNGNNALDLRLHNFTMTATDTVYLPDTEGIYAEDAKAVITRDGKIGGIANIYNYTGEDTTLRILLAAYKKDEDGRASLAKIYQVPASKSTFGTGVTRFSQYINEPEGGYDFAKVFFWDENMIPLTQCAVKDKPEEILVIGCSFSSDSTKYVHKIAESLGVEINVHHYFHSGGSIQSLYEARNATKSTDRSADAWYYSLNDGEQQYSSVNPGVTNPTLDTFLDENKLDAVIMQNYWSRSEHIAQYEAPENYTPEVDANGEPYRTYYASPYYVQMAKYLKEKQPDAKIIINSIWSNEQGYYMANHVTDNYTSEGFENESAYMYDLLEKYNGQSAIDVGAAVLDDGSTIGINGNPVTQFPAGYAIQYARNWKDENGENIFFTEKNWEDFYGWEKDTLYPAPVYEGKIRLSRDGYHLSPAGRYLVGCVWVEILTGLDVRNATYKPEYDDSFITQALDEYGNTVGGTAKYYYEEMDSETAALIRQIAHEAVEKFKSQSVRGLSDSSLEF